MYGDKEAKDLMEHSMWYFGTFLWTWYGMTWYGMAWYGMVLYISLAHIGLRKREVELACSAESQI